MKIDAIPCKKCGDDVNPARPGAVLYIPKVKDPILFCGRPCKSQFLVQTRPSDLLAAANATKGVASSGRKREPSRAEILKKMRPKETDISRSIGSQLDAAGLWNTRTQSGQVKTVNGGFMKLCRPGTPDRIFVAGLPVWIEVKRPGEVATSEQLKIHATLKANGCLVFVLDDPADLDFVLQGLTDAADRIQITKGLIMATQFEIEDAMEANRKARRK